MSTPAVILAIDDESQILRLLELTLEPAGYRLRTASNGRDGVSMAGTERPDLIILDLGLPDTDGKTVLGTLRGRTGVPIIVLSIRSEESDIISCLDSGADDYLVKPFRTGELLARIRTSLRRTASPGGVETMSVGPLFVNFASREVRKDGIPIHLTVTEYALLTLFVRNSGRVLTHRYLLEHVWGPEARDESQYTRVYVGQLRKKIEDNPSLPRLILTESGIGYRFVGE